MPQNVVGGGAVEIEVGKHEVHQVRLAFETHRVLAERKPDIAILRVVNAIGFEGLHERRCLSEPRLEIGEGLLRILMFRHFGTREPNGGVGCWRVTASSRVAKRVDQAACILRGRPRLRRRPFFEGRPTLLCEGALTAIVRALETGANSTITLPSEEMIILSIINPACCTPLIRSETFISFSCGAGKLQ